MAAGTPHPKRTAVATQVAPWELDPALQHAAELVGKRWSGAILYVMLQRRKPMRFSDIRQAVPQLSDRLLSERMKELEARGLIERHTHPDGSVRIDYELTTMGLDLAPALRELRRWGQRYLP